MPHPTRLCSLCFILASTSLFAQAPVELLKVVPGAPTSVAITPDLPRMDARAHAFTGAFGANEGFGDLEKRVGLRSAWVQSLVEADYAPEKDAEARPLYVFSTTGKINPAKLLKAKQTGACYEYAHTVQVPDKTAPGAMKARRLRLTLAQRGPLWVLSEDKARVLAALKATGGLDQELSPALEWIGAQGSSLVVPPAALAQSLKTLRDGMELEPKPGQPESPLKPLLPLLRPVMDSAVDSIQMAAVGLQFLNDGSSTGSARLFLRPESPLSRTFGGLKPLASPGLQGLPDGPWAVAGGLVQMPFVTDFQIGAMRAQPRFKNAAPGVREAWEQALLRQQAQVESVGYLIAPPEGPKLPLLSGLMAITQVKSGKDYLDASQVLAKAQGDFMEGLTPKIQTDVLPGTPSLSLEMDLSALAGDALPPAQVQMFGGLVFGGSRIQVSTALVSEHQAVSVLGDAAALRKALDRLKAQPALAEDAGVKCFASALPTETLFSLCVNLSGLKDLAQTVLGAFQGPGAAPLPLVPAVAPTGLVLSRDAKGIEVKAALLPETLKAIADFARTMQQRTAAAPRSGEK